MRILIISNLYPPHHIGGYELGCHNVVEALRVRGHTVCVLTSTYGISQPECNQTVYRWLQFKQKFKTYGPDGFIQLINIEIDHQFAFKQLCDSFKPDLIYVWNLRHLSLSLIFIAEQRGLPLCYFISDNWLAEWEDDLRYIMWQRYHQRFRNRIVTHKIVQNSILQFVETLGFSIVPPSWSPNLQNVQFASSYLKQIALSANRPVTKADIVHWGTDTNQYQYKGGNCPPTKLLYVGQIMPHKGVHTVIEAMALLVQEHGFKSIKLTILGGTVNLEYESYIHQLITSLDLESNINLMGSVSHERVAEVYQEHDILIFPSIWEEPFAITLLEAMASGLAVVSTATGGSQEILKPEVNALIFPKENAMTCATQIRRLINDTCLYERVRRAARLEIEEKFEFKTMVDQIENSLMRIQDCV